MLSGIENPLPMIMEDLNVRADRLADQLINNSHNNSYKKLILRPEFTIRNPNIPLEGRLDLLKIILGDPIPDFSRYITLDELVNLNIEDIEIVQIKTGKAKPRTPRIYMQADAEALLLMETLKLKKPPTYTWQFADKDVKSYSSMGTIFSSVRENNGKVIAIGDDKQLPPLHMII